MKDVNNTVKKMLNKASRMIEKKQIECALATISACATMQYEYNQNYVDEFSEKLLKQIYDIIFEENKLKSEGSNEETVLFYDSFGFDTRGLALIYLKAIARKGYKIVYVTNEKAIGNQPEIDKVLQGCDVKKVYISMNTSYLLWIDKLCDIFNEYRPSVSFLYTTPSDVAGVLVFEYFKGRTIRFQINLTDHAFWLGKYAFDYCVEFRNVGSSVSYNYRGIDKEKIILLPYYANIDDTIPFEGFPFEIEDHRVLFSGGSLYKTLGDKEKRYYRIVEHILSVHDDIIFVYAGSGDDTEIKKLQEKYLNRVYHIAERKDLYQVMRHSVLYLNTYPMCGGLMMCYAATAGKIPVTLRHYNDADGILLNQEKISIQYDDINELMSDVDMLLSDKKYLKEREKKLDGCVVSEEDFESNVDMLIQSNTTSYEVNVDKIDTSEFIKEYLTRFDYKKTVSNSVARKINKSLLFAFPKLFICSCLYKIRNRK